MVVVPVVVTTGALFTVMLISLVSAQLPLLPITEYVVLVLGLTVMLEPLILPGIHVYALAPLALSKLLAPAQSVLNDALENTVGTLATFTVNVVF